MAKKGKRVRKTDSPLRWYLKQNQRWLRRIGIVAGLAAVAVALWFIVDPLKGAPTATTETGEEVDAGVVDRPGAAARQGSTAPNFVLPDYDGRAVFPDQFEGRVVFVNFWASWCTFCEEEMPDIIELAEEYPDELIVLAVNRGESRGRAKSWSDGHDFPDLPNVYWLLDEREGVADGYRVRGMPQSFFVDVSGVVHTELRRVTDYSEMRDTLVRMIGDSESQTSGR